MMMKPATGREANIIETETRGRCRQSRIRSRRGKHSSGAFPLLPQPQTPNTEPQTPIRTPNARDPKLKT